MTERAKLGFKNLSRFFKTELKLTETPEINHDIWTEVMLYGLNRLQQFEHSEALSQITQVYHDVAAGKRIEGDRIRALVSNPETYPYAKAQYATYPSAYQQAIGALTAKLSGFERKDSKVVLTEIYLKVLQINRDKNPKPAPIEF